jgi:hypothetical protein
MTNILDRMLPKQIANDYPGHKIALYSFLVITVMTIARSLAHIVLPDGGASSIATIDLMVGGAGTIISIFAQWGLSQILMGVFYVVVYIRYKSLIPLMYIFIIIEYAARIGIGLLKPIETVGIAPGAVGNLIIIPLAILLFFFSIREAQRQSHL